MRYAIMSDVHANPQALDKALADARRQKCDRYLMLGDVTGYGYDVCGALARVREAFDVVLLGNHDSACIGLEREDDVRAIPNYDIDRSQRVELSESDVAWLKARRAIHVEPGLAFVHGDFARPRAWNYILYAEDAAANLRLRSEPLLFCGHSHHAAVWEMSAKGVVSGRFERRLFRPALKPESVKLKVKATSRYIVNVGSVGYPRNDLCATYCIYDSEAGTVTLRRLPFDFKDYILRMFERKIVLPNWLLELLEPPSR